MLSDVGGGKGVRLGITGALTRMTLRLPKEVAHVQEDDYEVIEGVEGSQLDREPAITVRRQPAFHLNSNLPTASSRAGVNADQVVAFVVGWSLAGQDVAAE